MSCKFINKDESSEVFSIEVKIRDENSKIFLDEKGSKTPSISFNLELYTREQLKFQMKMLCREFKAITPKGSTINIEAHVGNSISNTWMNVASYYDNKRFVKH